MTSARCFHTFQLSLRCNSLSPLSNATKTNSHKYPNICNRNTHGQQNNPILPHYHPYKHVSSLSPHHTPPTCPSSQHIPVCSIPSTDWHEESPLARSRTFTQFTQLDNGQAVTTLIYAVTRMASGAGKIRLSSFAASWEEASIP